jgi:hypothetical protein
MLEKFFYFINSAVLRLRKPLPDRACAGSHETIFDPEGARFRAFSCVQRTSAQQLLICGASEQQQIPVRILDDEILCAPGLFFQRLVKDNPGGLKLKKQ